MRTRFELRTGRAGDVQKKQEKNELQQAFAAALKFHAVTG
jgi:hypothetical protein